MQSYSSVFVSGSKTLMKSHSFSSSRSSSTRSCTKATVARHQPYRPPNSFSPCAHLPAFGGREQLVVSGHMMVWPRRSGIMCC